MTLIANRVFAATGFVATPTMQDKMDCAKTWLQNLTRILLGNEEEFNKKIQKYQTLF